MCVRARARVCVCGCGSLSGHYSHCEKVKLMKGETPQSTIFFFFILGLFT